MSSKAQSTQDNAGASSKDEREFEDTIPKHLPIKVKIKKEKEKAFKDLKNDKWVRDFELEVTNTGDKPIYLLHFTIVLPEIIGSSGLKSGFVLHYGRAELGDIETKAAPDDVPIKPGETYVFTISEGQVLGWDSFRKREKMPQPKKVILHFGILSFGDGTGFESISGVPFPPVPKERSSLDRCEPGPNKGDPKALELQHAALESRLKMYSTDILPASFLPVNFLSAAILKPDSFKPKPEPQTCCPGYGCFHSSRRIETSCLGCMPVTRLDAKNCNDPSGACFLPNYTAITCIIPETGKEYLCLEVDFQPCGGTTPPPSPSPPPSPEPSPTSTPCVDLICGDGTAAFPANSCALYLFDAHCPLGYEQRGNCCYLLPCPSPTPTPPPCDGILTFLDPPDCRWFCSTVLPTPTPTPTPDGGGATESTQAYCSSFYLVTEHYLCYQDGHCTYLYSDFEYLGMACLLTQ